jgi:hypothetical protein
MRAAEFASIEHDGHNYRDTPRIRSLIDRATSIQQKLPPVPQGHTRLWRGNRPGEIGSNPTFTNSLVGIALPFLDGYGGQLSYIDVPTQDLPKYVDKVAAAENSEFTVTPEIAKTARAVK